MGALDIYLKVRTGDRLSQLVEKRLLHLRKFGWVHDFEDIFHLVQVHDFFGAVRLRPVTQQTENNLQVEISI